MAEKLFAPDTPLGKAIYDFQRALNDDDRQTRAQLRRAGDLTSLVLVPGVHRLLHNLQVAAGEQNQTRLYLHSDRGRLRVAVIAGLLAQVKHHEPIRDKYRHSTAVLMAQGKKKSDGACVSELRFRRLLQADNLEALYPMLRRTLALMNHKTDIYALAGDVWYWNDRTRRQWAYDYYAKSA